MKVLHTFYAFSYLRHQNLDIVPLGTGLRVELSSFEVSTSFTCGLHLFEDFILMISQSFCVFREDKTAFAPRCNCFICISGIKSCIHHDFIGKLEDLFCSYSIYK